MGFGSIARGCSLAGLVAAVIAGGSANARDYDSTRTDETIVVQGPHATILREHLGRAPDSLLRQERVSYSIPVSIADIDFASPADRSMLEDRIYNAAWHACRELDRHFPPSLYVPTTSDTRRQCADRAADNGMAQARMIADARSPTYGDSHRYDDRGRYDDDRDR
jgi:UrcA family protein